MRYLPAVKGAKESFKEALKFRGNIPDKKKQSLSKHVFVAQRENRKETVDDRKMKVKQNIIFSEQCRILCRGILERGTQGLSLISAIQLNHSWAGLT